MASDNTLQTPDVAPKDDLTVLLTIVIPLAALAIFGGVFLLMGSNGSAKAQPVAAESTIDAGAKAKAKPRPKTLSRNSAPKKNWFNEWISDLGKKLGADWKKAGREAAMEREQQRQFDQAIRQQEVVTGAAFKVFMDDLKGVRLITGLHVEVANIGVVGITATDVNSKGFDAREWRKIKEEADIIYQLWIRSCQEHGVQDPELYLFDESGTLIAWLHYASK